MITTENIRRAADAFRDEFVYNLWDDFNRQIINLWEEKLSEFLNDYDSKDYDTPTAVADALCEFVADAMEVDDEYNGLTSEWSSIKTSFWSNDQFLDYYDGNRPECDDFLHDVDISSCYSIQSVINETVKFAYHRQAINELNHAIDTVRDGAQALESYLK